MSEFISMRAFAKLDGCAESLVRRAVKQGRLPLSAGGKLDVALVGTAWREGNFPRDSKPHTKTRTLSAHSAQDIPEPKDDETPEEAAARIAGEAKSIPPYADSMAKKEHFLALLREIEYRQKEGSLVEIDLAETILFESARAQRDSWLNWPARVAPLIAADLGVEADKMTDLLTTYIYAHIETLGEPDESFRKS